MSKRKNELINRIDYHDEFSKTEIEINDIAKKLKKIEETSNKENKKYIQSSIKKYEYLKENINSLKDDFKKEKNKGVSCTAFGGLVGLQTGILQGIFGICIGAIIDKIIDIHYTMERD